jgi:hypothetical protein
MEAAGIPLETYVKVFMSMAVLNTLIWAGTGLLIFILRSDDWMAMLVSAMLILFTTGQGTDPIGRAYPALAWISTGIFNLQNILLLLFVGLFPGGRFAPRWMRWYVLALLAFTLVPNQLIPTDTYGFLIIFYWLSFLILAPFTQIYRYFKTSSPVERQQTKWVVFGFSVMAAGILIYFIYKFIANPATVLAGSEPIWREYILDDFYFDLVALALPLSIGLSILRYRLWDIDVIIRKTLVYGILTAALALVFFGGVTLLQSLFQAVSGQQSAISIVVSTLAIAALFNPLRRRVQNFIDRRFFRKKYDAERAMAQFAIAARSETDIEQMSAELMSVVQETMQPEKVSLWLKPARYPRLKAWDQSGLKSATSSPLASGDQ